MAKIVTKTVFTIGLLTVLMSVPAFGASINKSINIEAGEESGGASSVNGSIYVGEDAVVTGGLRTVNGKIRVDSGAAIKNAKTVNGSVRVSGNVKAGNLSTVNGAVSVGSGSTVDGEVYAVNGSITLEEKSAVLESVGNVNGRISLSGAQIEGDLKTVNGDVRLEDQSVLKGDLVVEKPNNGFGWGNDRGKKRKPRIVVGPGSRVEGIIKLEREVELFVSDSAEIGGVEGVMSMDDVQRFSGENP